jgi:hypothetical protein
MAEADRPEDALEAAQEMDEFCLAERMHFTSRPLNS